MRRLVIGVTLGCPAGVGAEVVARALLCRRESPNTRFVLFGAPSSWRETLTRCRLSLDAPILATAALSGELPPISFVPAVPAKARFKAGSPGEESDRATARSLELALDAAQSGLLDAVATAPARKSAFRLVEGGPFPGHTELFHARLGRTSRPVMLFVAPGMRLALHTIHLPLRDVTRHLGGLEETLKVLAGGLTADLGISAPRIDVLALNPHASEGGLIGREDLDVVAPAIAKALERGIAAEGPFPADGYFGRYRERGRPAAVLALYHDQGLAPFKLWERGRGCQMTLGLRVPRTSCDHGTAYDVAGRCEAHGASMSAALDLAVKVARNRSRHATASDL